MCDCERPDAYTYHWRLARKEHTCCECPEPIKAGDRYHYFSGVWEGSGMSFKTCAACYYAREEYAETLGPYDCPPCFGSLWDEIRQDGPTRLEYLYASAVA